MSAHARLVMLAGLVLVIAGLAFALGFSYFVGHEARLAGYDDYQASFASLLQDPDGGAWRSEVARADRASRTLRRATDVHTHAVNMGIVIVLTGLLVPLLARLNEQTPRAVWLLIGAAWIYPLGLLLQFARLTRAGEAVAAFGAVMAIAALAWVAYKLSRALDLVLRS